MVSCQFTISSVPLKFSAEANSVCHYPRLSLSSHGDTGTIFSPNYPANFPTGITCSWTITVPEGRVRLTFEDLQLSSNNCGQFIYHPFVRVQDRKSLLLLANCTMKTPIVLESTYPLLWVTFNAKNQPPHRGFKAHYEAIPGTLST